MANIRAVYRRYSSLVTGMMVGILVIILSPLALLATTSILPLDWPLLSNVGQSYTGISALLAAIAVLAALKTMSIQNRQAEESSRLASRTLQFEIIRLIINDRFFAGLVSPGVEANEESFDAFRASAFWNMWMQYQEHAFNGGVSSEEIVRWGLREDMFKTVQGRLYWERSGDSWRIANPKFHAIVESEYKNSAASADGQ